MYRAMEQKRSYTDLTREIQRTMAEAIQLRKTVERNDPRYRELLLRVDQLNQERFLSPL